MKFKVLNMNYLGLKGDSHVLNAMVCGSRIRFSDTIYLFWMFLMIIGLFASVNVVFLFLAPFILAVFNYRAFIKFKVRRYSLIFFIGISSLIILSILNSSMSGSPLFYLLGTVICLISAKHTADHFSLFDIYTAMKLLYLFCIFFLGYFLYEFWGHPEPFGQILPGASTNGFPSYLIVVQILLSSISYMLFSRVSLFFPILTLSVSFFGNGRGSLVIAIAILSYSIFVNIFMNNVNRTTTKSFLHYAFYVSAFCVLLLISEQLWDNLLRYTKLSVGLVDSNRVTILNEYLAGLGVADVFFGGSYSGTVIGNLYNGNPHISFIRSHYLFGLVPTICYMVSPLVIFFIVKDKKIRKVLFGFILLLWLRAISEPILFPTIMDYFYFLIFFIALNRYGKKHANNVGVALDYRR